MITKDLVKAKIDAVQEEYLEALYKIVVAFGTEHENWDVVPTEDQASHWRRFVRETYGCLVDDPIERGDQGAFEIRETMK